MIHLPLPPGFGRSEPQQLAAAVPSGPAGLARGTSVQREGQRRGAGAAGPGAARAAGPVQRPARHTRGGQHHGQGVCRRSALTGETGRITGCRTF